MAAKLKRGEKLRLPVGVSGFGRKINPKDPINEAQSKATSIAGIAGIKISCEEIEVDGKRYIEVTPE